MVKRGMLGALWMLVGCDEAPVVSADAGLDALPCEGRETWVCPTGWVRAASGGCGPAVILCAPDGGAAAGTCAGEDLHAPRPYPTEDGGTGWRFGLAADGAVTGGWSERMPACAEGWTRLEDGSCVPDLRPCPTGASSLPGGRCTSTALSDCPDARFPARTPEMMGRAVLYVAADAPAAGADGSEIHPFRTIDEALPRVDDRGFVLLAEGRYVEPVTIAQRANVRGVCAARVTLGGGEGIVLRVPGELALRGVTVHGGAIVSGVLDADAVHFRAGGWRYALRVETASGRAELRDVRVEVSGEKGVDVVQRAHLTMSAFAVVGGVGVGISVADAEATLRDGVLSDLRVGALESEGAGRAIFAADHGVVDGEHLVIDRCQAFSVSVSGEGARFALRGGVIRDVQATATGGGKALQVDQGGVATLTGVRIERASNTAASAFEGGTLTVEDSVVLDTRQRPNGTAGRGLDAHHRASLHVVRTRIEGMHDVALFSYDGSQVTARDVVIRRTRVPDGQGFGAGIAALALPGQAGATIDARRVVIEDSQEEGFAAIGVGTEAVLEDVIVRGVLPSARGFAMGAITSGGAVLRANRVAVVDARGIGFAAQQYNLTLRATGTRVEAGDLFVRDIAAGQIVYSVTRPDQPPSGVAAYGVVAGEGTSCAFERVTLERSDVGIAALAPTTLLDISVMGASRAVVVGRSRVAPQQVTVRGVTCADGGALRIVPDDTLGDPQVPLTRPP